VADDVKIELGADDLIEIEVGRKDHLSVTCRTGEDVAQRVDDAASARRRPRGYRPKCRRSASSMSSMIG
jgi:hypothetical protein